MDPDPFEIESVLNLLSQTLGRIASVSILHDDERLIFKEGVVGWSVNEKLLE